MVCCCNAQGSNGNNCVANGICSCRANIVGRKCDSCASGSFNFPTCQGKQFLHTYLLILVLHLIQPSQTLTYCIPKCVHFAAVILEINFQFLAYM